MTGYRPCIHIIKARYRFFRQKIAEAIFHLPTARMIAQLADNEAVYEGTPRLHEAFRDPVISHERIGQNHDLPTIRRIGQNLLVPRHARIKDNLADRFGRIEQTPRERGAVFQKQFPVQSTPSPLLDNFSVPHDDLAADHRQHGSPLQASSDKRRMGAARVKSTLVYRPFPLGI